ncbi:MAG: stage II sporulation protein M [Anaerolineae bacterium]|nr:stage II sporulation protein M [Anaerolineae bacterium]
MSSVSLSPTESLGSAGLVEQARPWRQVMANALIITRREVRDSFRDWRIISPIIILTFFFPFLAQGVAASFSGFLAQYGAELIGERTIPFLLMIVGFFPISISLVIALETFVGEKERRSLEPLLSTPLSNTELYIGKTLSSMIPPLMASFGGMMVYLLSLLGGELAWRPPAMLIVQIFLLTLVQALVMVTGAVVVSSQTTSTRAANLLASFIIIPMTLIINGESVIMFLAPDAESPNGIGALWAIIVGMFVVVILLLRMGNAIFNREELLGRTIDSLNLWRSAQNIWRWVRAIDERGSPAAHLGQWYVLGVRQSLKRLQTALWATLAVFAAWFAIGFIVGQDPQWRLPLPSEFSPTASREVFAVFLGAESMQEAWLTVFWHNTRVLLLGAALALFSFGAAAWVLIPVVFLLLGYLLSQMILSGVDPSLYWAALLPHGIIEIPVVWLATAAMFRLGAVVTRPPRGMTAGLALTQALADLLRLLLAIILPGLLLAAVVEVFVTPEVVLRVLGS